MTIYDLVLWAIAASMALVISYSLKVTVDARKRRGSLAIPLAIFVLVMMLSMVASAVVYFMTPGIGVLIDLVVVNMIVMGLGALPFVLVIFRSLLADEGTPGSELPTETGGIRRDWGGGAPAATVVVLVLLNEFFMGWGFQLASGGLSPGSAAGLLSLFSGVVSSYWFLFTMAFEMAFTAFLLRREIPRALQIVIGFQAAVMFASPPAFADPRWVAASVFGGSILMIILFIFAFDHLARNPMVGRTFSSYLILLMAAYAVMMAGLFIWELDSTTAVFATSIVAEMVIYLAAVMGADRGASLTAWKSNAWRVLGLLTALFIGEFFMGALLDIQVAGAQSLLAAAGLVQITGGVAALGPATYDFLAFFSTVTLSPWFLIMMGAEMGALVLFRIREVKELETRVRLGLVIVAYGAYTVLLPNFVIPASALPMLPFVGWNMGVGTGGPVAPALLIALVGTYVFSGSLSFLFGARQFCSMFCSAALMYQGTFYDSLKTFNRTSTLGKKLLTSRLSDLYRAVFSLVWVSLIAAVAVSYLDSVGILRLSVFGADPTVFLYSFYFGFLWYVVFVTIPFVGTYGCVTMGWCHWGTFNQLVSRLGFFKLKVRDPNVCVTCETKDCAKACPVGLTDLPGSFIAKGEFKSSKCIGVGDCVGACPYSNEYFFDVRGWLRKGRGTGAASAMVDFKGLRSHSEKQ